MPTVKSKERPGVHTLGIEAGDTTSIIHLIEKGFPFHRLERLQKAVDLPPSELARLLSIPLRTISRRRNEGRLQPDESERVLRASTLFDRTVQLFDGDEEAARQWLKTSQPGLGGAIPIEYGATEVGAKEVENLIGRLEYGVVT